MIEILFENTQEKIKIGEDVENAIKAVCQKALEYENCAFDAQISVTITDNEEIHAINKEHRGIDRPTDVLSFPMIEFDENGEADEADFEYDGDFVMLGDIVISAERAASQAKEYGHGFLREMAFLTAHSMLHLLGYDHVDSENDEKQMCEKQEEILSLLGYTREK